MSSSDQEPTGSDARLDALVRASAAARQAALAGHPDPDELADYSLGALPPAEMERLAEHLALCAGCAQVVLDLTAILRAEPAATAAPPAELDREWERLAARLRLQEEEEATGPKPAERRATPFPRSLPPAAGSWALAASLLLAAGLLAWGVSQHRELAQTGQPSADVALLNLNPLGVGTPTERSGERLPEAVPPAGATVALLLNLGELRTFPSYGIELRAPDGSLAWQETGALRAASGQFLLEIPRQSLAAAGTYRVEVSGLAGTARVRLAEYAFRVPEGRSSEPGR